MYTEDVAVNVIIAMFQLTLHVSTTAITYPFLDHLLSEME